MPQTGLVAHERYFWHDPGSGAGFSSSNPYALGPSSGKPKGIPVAGVDYFAFAK